ncbi:helix-turn-helix domain-containing protein [Actinacidiphila yeochonensis]|uniref:helix-turn-helix domain-containing protein n=1 Tax=Actinacidiphila yeochonensis TaxID=89050 RepID=UPI0006905DD2|nr:helix-turn-helix domain-containing protein [Actinacidiphila yeochonensis]
MLRETEFRSEDLPAADRFEVWQDLLSRTYAPMHLSSEAAADFHAHQRVITLGEVSIWPATFQHLVFRRTPKLIRQSDPENCHLSLLLRGSAVASWDRNEAAYRVYDIHTNDTSLPFELSTGHDRAAMVGIEVPKRLVGLPWDSARQVIGGQISWRNGVGALLGQFVSQVAADTSVYRAEDGPRLGQVISDLVTALFANVLDSDEHLQPETRSRTAVLGAKAFIRQNLGDPELTPSAVAAALHVSRSHLYGLFRAEGIAIAAYIRDQRLEAARHELTDPARAATPIHAIAARWGFKDHATFTRSFRTAYGTAPRDLRHLPPERTDRHGGTGPA